MKPGFTYQTGEFDSEILASGDFQLISITLDSTARYATDGTNGSVTIPKGTLIVKDTDLSDGTYTPVVTIASLNGIAGSATQFMKDAVVLAETIVDASAGDQPVKAYWAGTFKFPKLKYNGSEYTVLTLANFAAVQRIKVIDGPSS